MTTPSRFYTAPTDLFGARKPRADRAFTRLEILVVVGVLMLLALVCLPLLANTSLRSNQISCLNNLRQIGVAFQAWGTDYDDRRPWFVPMDEGGSRSHPLRNNAYIHYSFLSNHISPEVLVDPVDPRKRMARTWDDSPYTGFLNPSFRNNAVSYMVGSDAYPWAGNTVLVADSTVEFNGFGSCPSGGGLAVGILLTDPPSYRGWTNGGHGIVGNVLLNDGGVETMGRERFREVFFDPSFPGMHVVTPP